MKNWPSWCKRLLFWGLLIAFPPAAFLFTLMATQGFRHADGGAADADAEIDFDCEV